MRYYFHLASDGGIVRDDCGIERPNLEYVRTEVVQAIMELRYENPLENWDSWRLDITDASGRRLFSVNLARLVQ